MYTTGYILVLVWFVILGISLFVTGRVLYLPFVKLWNFIRDEEEIKYDAHFNPYKFRLHVVYIVMLFYPFWFYNYFIRLTKLWDAVAFLVCGSIYVSLITWVVLKKIKEPTKKWNIKNSVQINELTEKLIELKQGSLTADVIKKDADIVNIENKNIVPLLNDERIKNKITHLENSYNLRFNKEILSKILKREKVVTKLLFRNNSNEIANFKKIDFLKILDNIVDYGISNHKTNKTSITWIETNFDTRNLKTEKIISKDISDLKYECKKEFKGRLSNSM